MIEDLYLPMKIGEKYRKRFLKNTIKIGEYMNFEGFIVSIKSEKIREKLWKKLSPVIGDFSVWGITPFPDNDFPIFPIIIPHWLKKRGRIARIEGKIYDFSQFSNLSGRFMIVDKFERIPEEKYLMIEKTGLDGRKIYRIFDTSFTEMSRDIFLSYFMASPKYVNRIGGCTVTFLKSLSKYYWDDFKAVNNLVSEIHPMLKNKSFNLRLIYDEEINININFDFKIKYQRMSDKNALKFYSTRRGREWEKSAITESIIKKEKLIGYSEIPYLPRKEEMNFYTEELKEYDRDIAFYVFRKHLKNEEIDEKFVERFKERFIRKINSEFPLFSEAMRMGILMDISDVNGFGEHLARLINSWQRLELENPEEKVLGIYLMVFERLDDLLHDKLKRKISSLGERKRIERMINRVLWELNALKPTGWSYEYFEKKMRERGIEERTDKIFQELLNDGYVIMKKKDSYLAVVNL